MHPYTRGRNTAKIYGINTVDGRQLTSLRARQYRCFTHTTIPYKPYCTVTVRSPNHFAIWGYCPFVQFLSESLRLSWDESDTGFFGQWDNFKSIKFILVKNEVEVSTLGTFRVGHLRLIWGMSGSRCGISVQLWL